MLNRNTTILSFQANIFAIIVSLIFGVKIISRSNSSSSGWSQNLIKQKIFEIFFKRVDEIIVNSYEFKKEMDKKYKINTNCILNPFDFKKIKKLSSKKISNIYEKNNLKLISVGRLTFQKDFLTLLKAIKICKKKNIELIILGKGNQLNELRNFCANNNISSKVKFLGYKTNPYKYINQADIFILTSIFEGSPNVLIEALYLNKFIISTDCPTGPREILENGKYGTLIKIGNFSSLAKEIEKFKFNKRTNMKIQSLKKSLYKYDKDLNCEKYYNLIKKHL